MTNYRVVARHVRYWRGVVHKWSTVYPLSGTLSVGNYSVLIGQFKALEQGVNWKGGGAASGGLYEIALYDQATGGVPVAVSTYFPWNTPGSWVAYGSLGWSATTAPLIPQAEVALQVEWQAGFSSSGKPVYFRKWYHSVPDQGTPPAGPDVPAADVTHLVGFLQTQMALVASLGAPLGNSGRLAATTPTVLANYGNHQMPRGRRRPKAKAGGGVSFPAGILVVPGSDGSLEVSGS